jgi:hypothetical protein
MRLRWHITRQWWSLWMALMVVREVDAAEFMVGITPAVHALHDRVHAHCECVEQRIENRRLRKAAAVEHETARERGGTI